MGKMRDGTGVGGPPTGGGKGSGDHAASEKVHKEELASLSFSEGGSGGSADCGTHMPTMNSANPGSGEGYTPLERGTNLETSGTLETSDNYPRFPWK